MSPSKIRLLTYAVLVGLIVLTTALAKPWTNTEGLWMSLFVESIGIAITVGVIENLLRQEAERRSRPARFAAFREASRAYARARGLWSAMLTASFDPINHKNLVLEANNLLDPSLGHMIAQLNLDSQAPVIPRRTWRVFIPQQTADIEETLSRGLQRYAPYMEPEMIVALQDLERSSLILYAKILPALREADAERGVNRGSYFGWGANDTARDFIEPLIGLAKLLNKEALKFADLSPNGSVTKLDTNQPLDDLRNKVAKP